MRACASPFPFNTSAKDPCVSSNSRFELSRRKLLFGAAAAAIAPRFAGAVVSQSVEVMPQPARAALLGSGNRQTDILTYNGSVPSPVLRLKQGVPFRADVTNRLDQDTTIHWHGIRVPNAMDGVPGLTQPPIKPGDSFIYEFTPPDAGTFWYHPHANSLEQMGRGLAGLLIVEEKEPVAVDRDIAWLLQDWRLTDAAMIAEGFGGMMEAAMSGRVGNLVTINGAPPREVTVRAGERLRLRLANAALARIFGLRFEGHTPVVIAIDGQPCEPYVPDDSRVIVGPAMRVDLLLDAVGKPGGRHAVVDDFYDGLSYRLTDLVYEPEALRPRPPGAALVLPRNPLPEPDIAKAHKHDIVLQGGMMGGGSLKGVGGMMGMAMPGMDGGPIWAINGMSMTGDGHKNMPPLFTLQRGESCLFTMRNETAWWHTMHIHGFSVLVLSRNGKPVPHRQWQDTVLMAPTDVIECAFVTDNPGDWMLHCHITDHQMAGLMTVFRVT
jgi:FtsP/CotA-like multicopper oxidase with cupredoxin domain